MSAEGKDRITHLFLLISAAGVFVWSLIEPVVLRTWFLQILPVLVGSIVLISTYSRFQFTTPVYWLMWTYAIIIMVAAHFTYENMPLFNWIRDTFQLSRNHYDRVGHFSQGFVPAIVVREILIRTSPLKKGAWLFFIVVCISFAVSAFYELIEWRIALVSGMPPNVSLGIQGDIWDTEWDMVWALCGAIVSQLALSTFHDRQLKKNGLS